MLIIALFFFNFCDRMNLTKTATWIVLLMIFGVNPSINLTFADEKLQSRFSAPRSNTNQNLIRIRFGTVIGSPPFGFLDRSNRVSGLNVDLVRRICSLLVTIPNCEIQAISAEDAQSALKSDTIDALVGAITPTDINRFDFNLSKPFTRSVYFYVENKNKINPRKLGVLDDMFSETITSALSNNDEVINFENYDALFDALSSNEVSSAFVPSHAAQFWLLSEATKACCVFEGPIHLPFTTVSPYRIATKRTNAQLHALLEKALYDLETSGSLNELRRRYFPLAQGAKP